MPQRLIDMTGMRFGRLVVIERADHNTNGGKPLWICKCDCGAYTTVTRKRLIGGETISCGCFRREHTRAMFTTHGLSKEDGKHTRLYRIWSGIKDRCCNPNSEHWDLYGNRGIMICDEWRDSFPEFYEWAMKNGYADNLTIDRIDTDGNYEPDNCRWATYYVQENNRRNNILYSVNGEILTLSQLSKRTELSRFEADKKYKEARCNGN